MQYKKHESIKNYTNIVYQYYSCTIFLIHAFCIYISLHLCYRLIWVVNLDVLINKIVNELTIMISKNANIGENDTEKVRYALIVIINEMIKIIVLSTIFVAIGKFNYFIFSMIILLILRTFSGGKHYNSSFICLTITIVFFIISCIVFVDYIIVPLNMIYLFLLISLLLIVLFSPCPNPKRPIRHKKRKRNLKITSVFLSFLVVLILLFLVNEKFLYCGTITMTLQSIQLIHKRKECFE